MTTLSRKFANSVSNWADAFEEHNPDSHMARVVEEFRDRINKGLPIDPNPQIISGVIDAIRHPDALDDRRFLLENLLTMMSNMPQDAIYKKLQNAVVMLLYNDLGHPPATYIGPKYAWRTADGSYNNIADPDMGKANTPYSRSVQSTHPLPANMLPDSGLVFDALLKREKFVKHPGGLSSLMFAFAALVIHTCFRTSHRDVNINGTSSYVDLSPLYGHDQAALDLIRVRDGRGLLKPDTFAEDRLLLLPPAVCVLLVLFSRNHNYIATRLLEINERGWYTTDPSTISGQKLLEQEEDIFQTARLINCGWFASIVFSDYFSAILGLVRTVNPWSLDPFEAIRESDHSLAERGLGNVCSVEFNCLYRWHATTSVQDEQWVTYAFGQIFPGKTPDQITPEMFKEAFIELQKKEPDVTHWTFGDLKRQENGTFKDSELAGVLQDATANPAAQFGARGTPSVMRLHEIMGIEQSRRWGVCSMNEFRKFLGLKPYTSFKAWNDDDDVARTAERLYGHIDNLELYPGLQAEQTKPVMPGAGLCPGYTLSRAILSDAIALTRGDRFYTSDNTPFNLTSWGFNDTIKDPQNPGFGSMLGRLFLRTLPGQYSEDSVFTWFPLMTPDSMRENLIKLGKVEKYTFTRPVGKPPLIPVEEYHHVAEVLKNTLAFLPPYVVRSHAIIQGKGFFLSGGDSMRQREQREVWKVLSGSPQATAATTKAFYQHTLNLLEQQSYSLVGTPKIKCVDIVRDVLRFVPIRWASEIAGLPLTPPGQPGYTEQRLYQMLVDVYTYLFLDSDASKAMRLEERVKLHVNDMLGYIRSNLHSVMPGGLYITQLVVSLHDVLFGHKQAGSAFLSELSQTGHPVDQLANSTLAVVVGATVELSQAIVNMINMYLDSPHLQAISALAVQSDPKSEALLEGYAREALRLVPAFSGVYRLTQSKQFVGATSVQPDQLLYLSITKANLDPKIFPDPTSVNPERTARDLTDEGAAHCLGYELTYKILAQVLRAVFSLKNLRRGPGQSGQLKRFPHEFHGTIQYKYLDENQQITPWATSMIVQFDG